MKDDAPETIEQFSQDLADAAEKSREQAANEIVGQLGMKAAGPAKAIRSFDGSPLFGEAQGSLFTLDKPNNQRLGLIVIETQPKRRTE